MPDQKSLQDKVKVIQAARAIANAGKAKASEASPKADGLAGASASESSQSPEKSTAGDTVEKEERTESPTGPGKPAKDSTAAIKQSPADILSRDTFHIRLIQLSKDDGGVVKSFVSSKDLKQRNLDARTVSLEALRALIPPASKLSKRHKFCSPSGMTIPNESITFDEYIAIDPEATVDAKAASEDALQPIPAVKLFFKTDSILDDPPDLSKLPEMKIDNTLRQFDPAKAKEFVEEVRKSVLAQEKDLQVIQGAGDQKGPGSLSEDEWSLIMRNCNVLYGWYFDRRTRQVVRAPKQAFKLRQVESKVSVQTASPNSDVNGAPKVTEEEKLKAIVRDQVGKIDNKTTTQDETQHSEEGEAQKEAKSDTPAPATFTTLTTLTAAVPNFRVNDNSRIDVMACSHEHELSMARNDFNSTSVEASASGGFGGYSASVSAGFSRSAESSSKETKNSFQSIMLAKYLYPRCDLLFEADDLEPTPDFKAAIAHIRAHKSITDLRKLHSTFGQFFCCKVTLGGRLSATKVMTETKTASEQTQKQQFKASVGISVSTPFGGGSVKAEHQQGSSSATNETEINKREDNAFEAVGGDTILANNPALWAPTVANFRYWRIIDRDEMVPLIDLLTFMPGFTDIKTHFIQAVPALDRYITLDQNREATIRLKVQSPANGMSSYPQDQVIYFLGHQPKAVANPRLNKVKSKTSQKTFWTQVNAELSQQTIMFKPAAYRAPAIIGYVNNHVGGAGQYGANYSPEFLETQWDIIAPFNEALTHGARVILKNRPYRDDQVKSDSTPAGGATGASTAQPIPTPAPTPQAPNVTSHMIVFRNQQGVFLPAMSDSDEVQFWRILKKDSSAEFGSHIKDGEEVRLCWKFKDQTVGYRDFTDDVFGRRRYEKPSGISKGALYLKLPWPRFETVTNVTGKTPPSHYMMMTPQADRVEQWYSFRCLEEDGIREQTVESTMQDMVFRIDKVANQGYGDSGDYLLRNVRQDESVKNVHVVDDGKVGIGMVFHSQPMPLQHQIYWM